MFRVKTLVLLAAVTCGQSVYAPAAEAGPLLDWLFRRNRCNTCVPTCAPPVATCQTTCQQTCSRTVVNYVPYTAYRTDWERVPVTTYQQTSSTDPCTGCTVTCNKPCTTYNWRMKQTPYTTYRPVYTQETYQVPVTYTTQVAAAPVYDTGCSTCSSGFAPAAGYQAPVATSPYPEYYQQAPASGGTIYQPTPAVGTGTTGADLQPTLNPQSSNRPVMIEGTSGSTSTYWPTQIQSQPTAAPISPLRDPNPEARWNGNQPPQLHDPFNQSTSAPSVQRWGYSPVRLASHEVADSQYVDNDVPVALRPQAREFVGSLHVEFQQSQTPQPRVNEGWRND